MKSRRTKRFKELLDSLPWDIQSTAKRKFRLWQENPSHPSLHFKPIEKTKASLSPLYEIRINITYRAVCFRDSDTYVWVWIGHHGEFDKLIF